MQWVIHYDVAACIILLIISVLFITRKNFIDKSTKVYSAMLICAGISSIFDLLTVYTYANTSTLPKIIIYIISMIYLASLNMISVLYYLYVRVVTEEKSTFGKFVCVFVTASDLIIIILSYWFGTVFAFKNGEYVRNPGMFYLYFTALMMLILGLITSIRYRYRLSIDQKISFYYFTSASIIVVIFQMYFPKILVIDFTCALYLMLLYISIQNPEEYVEKNIKTLNGKAFKKSITNNIAVKKEFTVIVFELDGFKYINEILGVKNGDQLIASVASFLKENFSNNKIYHLTGIRFAIVSYNGNYERAVEIIKKRFEKPWKVTGVDVVLIPLVCYVQYPKQVSTVDEIMYAIDYSIQEARENTFDHVVFASRGFLEQKHRETAISQIIKSAIMNDEFQVYYQPIYNINTGKFSSAEALVRLIDNELGFISPEEFIPIAEKNGTILKVGQIVFDKVCRFLKESESKNLGVDYVEVNLSVVQCMQENLAEQLIEIMDSYNIPYSKINLEITETANFNRNEILVNNMNQLINKGITFSMDDYGTGFSTTNYLIELPFRLVKIDKSIVWAAMENDKALMILRYTVSMIRSLDLQIVAEGVENLEQVEILADIGCDYLQGYYYSKPIPEKDYVNFLVEALEKSSE